MIKLKTKTTFYQLNCIYFDKNNDKDLCVVAFSSDKIVRKKFNHFLDITSKTKCSFY